MCGLYADQDPGRYAGTTRSIRLGGHSTSIRLEQAFWDVLDRIADCEGKTTPALISELYGEVMARDGGPANFTSLLRCSCLLFLERGERVAAPTLRRRAG